MIESDDYHDPQLNVPVYSLYGKVREPTDEMLKGIDVLLIDLQDVGTRVYTFVSTMVACLRAASRAGCKVIMLDRPNPIGGVQIEGHVLDPEFRSFVGELEIPMRHGMTIGELAGWANAELAIGCELAVIEMRGWQRTHYWQDTGKYWVAPSPNMPTSSTAVVYPGTVMFEGTNVSEGRGTTQPFEIIGAPFIDPHRLVAHAKRQRLVGVELRLLFFEPTFHKWAGQCCGGVQIHVLDRDVFQPYRTALVLMRSIAQLWPHDFAFREPPYEYELERMPIDIITGGDRVRTVVTAGGSVAELLQRSDASLARFADHRRSFLLY
jgi:uncharacterized protein YbbC (DUF1343 family)